MTLKLRKRVVQKFGKNKNKECIFGVGTAVSPDLQLETLKKV